MSSRAGARRGDERSAGKDGSGSDYPGDDDPPLYRIHPSRYLAADVVAEIGEALLRGRPVSLGATFQAEIRAESRLRKPRGPLAPWEGAQLERGSRACTLGGRQRVDQSRGERPREGFLHRVTELLDGCAVVGNRKSPSSVFPPWL
jgi:hypothetical protein